jgi:hypothetical protein
MIPTQDVKLSLLLLESLDNVRAVAPLTQADLRTRLVALCDAHDLGLTEAETTQAVQHCWKRLEKEQPTWLATPKGQAWQTRLKKWQRQGRLELQAPSAVPLPAALPPSEPKRLPSETPDLAAITPLDDLPWVKQGQRPPTLEALTQQRACWEARVKELDRLITLPGLTAIQRSARRLGGFMGGLLMGCVAGGLCLMGHHATMANALPWVGMLLSAFIVEIYIQAPETDRDIAKEARTHIQDQLRRHALAEPGVDIRRHDPELWQQHAETAALLAQFQHQSEVPLLVRETELLNATLGEVLYRAFKTQQDQQFYLLARADRNWGSSYDLGL